MLRLAFRNLFRHRGRSALTLAVIVFGVVGLILSGGFVRDVLLQLRDWSVYSRLGHLQVYRDGYYRHGRRDPYQYMIDAPRDLADRLAGLPHVREVLARVSFFGLLNNGRADVPVLVEGGEVEKESQLASAMTIEAGRQLEPRDQYGAVIGRGVADALTVGPGDYLTLVCNTTAGAMNSTELEVVGVFSTYSKEYDARAIRVLLDAAHAVLDTEAAHSLVLALDDTDATDTVRASVAELTRGGGYEVMTWRELDDFYRKAVALYQRQFSIFQAIILLMVLLSVANSVNMSAYERVGEFGTLRALGQRSQDVFRLVLAENGLMGLVGAVLGGVLGVLLAAAISHVGIPMPPPPNASKPFTAAIRPDALIVFSGVAIGFAATVASALLAARRASQVPIAEALRQNV